MEQPVESIGSIFNFGFDEESKSHIKTISLWALINAVISFMGLALSMIQFVMASRSVYVRTAISSFGTYGLFVMLIRVALSLLLNITLYNVALFLKRGIEGPDGSQLSKGFRTLRNYYKIYGIITIVSIVLGLLALVWLVSLRQRY